MNAMILYRPGNSIFHYCDSRTKLALMLCFTIVAFLFFNPLVPLTLMLAGLFLNVLATKRYALNNALTKFFAIIIMFSVVIHGFVNPLGKTPGMFWGHPLMLPFFGAYNLEGAYFGLTFGFRIAAIGLVALLYVSTTHPREVVRGLVKIGLPYNFGFMILMSLQLIPISNREAKTIMSAQRTRGLVERNLWDKLRGLIPLFIPLVVISLERMETMAMALEARAFGYTEKPTQLQEIKFTSKDVLIIASSVVLLIIGLVVRFRYGRLSWIDQLNSWGSIFWPVQWRL